MSFETQTILPELIIAVQKSIYLVDLEDVPRERCSQKEKDLQQTLPALENFPLPSPLA